MEKPFPDVFVAATRNLRKMVNVSVPQPDWSVKQHCDKRGTQSWSIKMNVSTIWSGNFQPNLSNSFFSDDCGEETKV